MHLHKQQLSGGLKAFSNWKKCCTFLSNGIWHLQKMQIISKLPVPEALGVSFMLFPVAVASSDRSLSNLKQDKIRTNIVCQKIQSIDFRPNFNDCFEGTKFA